MPPFHAKLKRSITDQSIPDDFWRHKDQQFRFIILIKIAFEQETDTRQIGKEWYLVIDVVLSSLEYSPKHDSFTILNLHIGFDFTFCYWNVHAAICGWNRINKIGLIFGNEQIHQNTAAWGDLGQDIHFQHRINEFNISALITAG